MGGKGRISVKSFFAHQLQVQKVCACDRRKDARKERVRVNYRDASKKYRDCNSYNLSPDALHYY